jgi:hypothetical protein
VACLARRSQSFWDSQNPAFGYSPVNHAGPLASNWLFGFAVLHAKSSLKMKSFLTIRLEEETTEAVEIPATPSSPTPSPLSMARPPRKPRTKPAPLPPLDEVRRILLENHGAKYDAICQVLPVSRWRLKKLYADLGIPAPTTPYTHPRIQVSKERLEEMIARKMTRPEMAKVLGISTRGLINTLGRYGLKPYDPFEENRNLSQKGLRRCSDCRRVKSLELDFSLMTGGNLGKNSRCKPCASASSLKSYFKKRAGRAAATPDSAPEVIQTSEPKADSHSPPV